LGLRQLSTTTKTTGLSLSNVFCSSWAWCVFFFLFFVTTVAHNGLLSAHPTLLQKKMSFDEIVFPVVKGGLCLMGLLVGLEFLSIVLEAKSVSPAHFIKACVPYVNTVFRFVGFIVAQIGMSIHRVVERILELKKIWDAIYNLGSALWSCIKATRAFAMGVWDAIKIYRPHIFNTHMISDREYFVLGCTGSLWLTSLFGIIATYQWFPSVYLYIIQSFSLLRIPEPTIEPRVLVYVFSVLVTVLHLLGLRVVLVYTQQPAPRSPTESIPETSQQTESEKESDLDLKHND
jgi:hypothetical protein